jgi:hypothetical protein
VLLLIDVAAFGCLAAASLSLWLMLPLLVCVWLGLTVDVRLILKVSLWMLAAAMGFAAVAGEIRNRR